MHRALLQDRIDGPHWMTLEAFFGLYTIEDMAMEIAGVESFEEVSDADLVATCERVKAAVVADDEAGTVTYTLNMATPWFLAMLANSFMGAVVDKEWMIENGAWDDDCSTWVQWHDPAAEDTILFDQANGTGPYKLDLDTRRGDRAGRQRGLLAAGRRSDLGGRSQWRAPDQARGLEEHRRVGHPPGHVRGR
jgi:peptide/nickel transport system substrate-binding protein